MSQILYALVVLQGTSFTVDPGHTSKSECEAVFKGAHTLCYPYDPSLNTWTAFFRLPAGGIRAGRGFANRDECELHIGAFRVCKPLAYPTSCTPVACIKPLEPPPPAAKPEPDTAPKPDPASVNPGATSGYRLGQACERGWSAQECASWRLTGVHNYIAMNKPLEISASAEREVAPGPSSAPQTKETVTPQDRPAAPKPPAQTQQPPEPFKALIDLVMLPFDFLSYPGRRDW
jgi:hypothetical protein